MICHSDITFGRISEIQSFVKIKGQTVGWLEKTIGGYLLSIDYSKPIFISTKHKGIIKMMVLRIHGMREKIIENTNSILQEPTYRIFDKEREGYTYKD